MDYTEADLILKNSLLNLSRTLNIHTGLWPFLTRKEQITKNIFFILILTLALIPEVSNSGRLK